MRTCRPGLMGLIAVGIAAAGCGSAGSTNAAAGSGSAPTVLAAASLTKVFPRIDPDARYTFGGSGALKTQIEQGAPADVFAAASPKQPGELYAKGLVGRPVEFATNLLVLIVPKGNPSRISSVSDVTKQGVKLVICNPTVPCGDYARTVFKNLGITAAAMKHVASEATDVTQVVAEVALSQADAGIVYITDAEAAKGKVAIIRLPSRAKPYAADFIAPVKAGKHRRGAESFVQKVLSRSGQALLQAAGFGKP